jgi:hypothetical protein
MRRVILRTSNTLGREVITIPFSTEALKATPLRLQNELEAVQASRDRNAIYQYLAAVFELVTWWEHDQKEIEYAHRALHLQGHKSVSEPEPFAAVILCTADPKKSMIGCGANGRGRCGMPRNTRTWMSRCVTSSSANVVSTDARRGLLVALGEGARIPVQLEMR